NSIELRHPLLSPHMHRPTPPAAAHLRSLCPYVLSIPGASDRLHLFGGRFPTFLGSPRSPTVIGGPGTSPGARVRFVAPGSTVPPAANDCPHPLASPSREAAAHLLRSSRRRPGRRPPLRRECCADRRWAARLAAEDIMERFSEVIWKDGGTGSLPPLRLEWLVPNGLGGYAAGTIAGAPTRRYHALLVAALPNPLGRVVMLNALREELWLPDGSAVR